VVGIGAQASGGLVSLGEVGAHSSSVLSVIYEQIRTGRLRTVKQGRTRLVPASAIADYIALLERETLKGAA
jgi:hypothetical protein